MRRRRIVAAAVGLPWLARPAPAREPAPADGWTRLADLPEPLAKFGIAALGDRLHVVGGYDTRRSHWVYDPTTDRWQAGPPLPRGSDNLALLALAGRLMAIGGEAGTAVQVYDPAAQAWHAGPPLPAVRFASAAAVLAGRIHLAGGWNADNRRSASLASQVVFDPGRGAWLEAPPLATPRNAAAAAVLEGRLMVAGGRAPGIRADDQQALASMEVFEPRGPGTGDWQAGPALPQPRAGLALVALGGRLLAFGGETTGGRVSDEVTRYDPASRSWSALAPMPWRSHGLGAVVRLDAVHVMGGFGGPSDAVGTESVVHYRYRPAP